MEKRKDYISWDEYFMGVAMLAGQRSKDPNTQVGACIVSDDNKILSIGYNGMPLGCDDDDFSWNRNREEDNKYFYIVHSNECAKAIIQSGIKEVIYWRDDYKDTREVQASKRLFQTAGVTITAYEPSGRHLSLQL